MGSGGNDLRFYEHYWYRAGMETKPARDATVDWAFAMTLKRILVVDDNEDALDPLADLLRLHGHIVETAKDGPSALEIAKTFKAEVAILDIGLPMMDGCELAKRLRATMGPETPRMIALSGYGQDSDRARSSRAGFAVHLTKPVEASRLLEMVEH